MLTCEFCMPRHNDPIARSATPLSMGEDSTKGAVYKLPAWNGWSDAGRVRYLRRLCEQYGAEPRMRYFTVQVFQRYGAAPRDFDAQAKAILRFAQENIYYVNESDEQLQSPWRTLKERAGDCFAEGTLVLRDDYELVKIEDVKVGERIWGYDRWSVVEATAAKGVLPVTEIDLNNGSTLRLTEDHKVYVMSCEKHGPGCPDLVGSASNCKKYRRTFTWERYNVSQLRAGWQVKQPERIECGGRAEDVDLAWLDGVYLADGWSESHKCRISGQDGCSKEEQKRRVVRIAEKYGETTRWHRKYVTLHAGPLARRLKAFGADALSKRIHGLDRDIDALHALDEGLQADASRNTCGAGWTYGTINRTMAVQYRVLQRILGRSTSWRYVAKHGGFGKNPIYRVGVRMGMYEKRLKIAEIRRDVEAVACFDIQTDDHQVYLPEADCTVSNCDDLLVLICSMAQSVGLGWRIALAGFRDVDPTKRPETRAVALQARAVANDPSRPPTDRARAAAMLAHLSKVRVRWVEGQPWKPASYVHVYPMLGTPALAPTLWRSAEPTIPVPLGHDVVLHGVPAGTNGGKDLAGFVLAHEAAGVTVDPTTQVLPARMLGASHAFGRAPRGGLPAPTAPPTLEGTPVTRPGDVTQTLTGMAGVQNSVVANLLNGIDFYALLNSVVQGVGTALAIAWVSKRLKVRV